MDKLIVPDPSNGIPFNWDDLDFFLGQESYDSGIYSFLTDLFSYYGTDFIICGCENLGGSDIDDGYIFMDSEILRVEAQTATNSYFEKVTTYNTDGNKQTQLSGTTDIYEKNRGVHSASSGTLTRTGVRFEQLLTNNLDYATNAEVITGTITDQPPSVASLANRMGGLIIDSINIGDWDMDANASPASSLNTGIALSDFRGIISTLIIPDSNAGGYPINFQNSTSFNGNFGVVEIAGEVHILLTRETGGYFDSTDYNSTSFNRGYVVYMYEQ